MQNIAIYLESEIRISFPLADKTPENTLIILKVSFSSRSWDLQNNLEESKTQKSTQPVLKTSA